MKKSKLPGLSVPLISLVGANLVPMIGVIWLDWDAALIILAYWAENLVVGFYNIIKIAAAKAESAASHLSKLFVIPFFCIHFGGFCAVHGIFLLTFLGLGNDADPLDTSFFSFGPLIFIGLLISTISAFWQTRPPGMDWLLAGLFISHGISFFQNYIMKGEYRTISMKTLMGLPYKRIVLMHVTILAGGIPIMALGSPLPLLFILLFLKIFMDIRLHLKEH